MNYDESLQLEIDVLEHEINHPLPDKYLVWERNDAEDDEIKRAIVACLAWMKVEREIEQRAEIN